MEDEKPKPYEKVATIISIIIYIFVLFGLAILSNANIFSVFIGTLPLLLYLVVFFYFVRIDYRMTLIWILPLLFPLIFLFIWYSKSVAIMRLMDGPVLAALNVLLSYGINIVVLIIYTFGSTKNDRDKRRETKPESRSLDYLQSELDKTKSELKETKKELYSKESDMKSKDFDMKSKYSEMKSKENSITEKSLELQNKESDLRNKEEKLKGVHQELKGLADELKQAKKEINVSKDNFSINLRSIEDKCKAINFVIGRVYSDKKGANEDIRSQLRIDSELYNTFSQITTDFEADNASQLLIILNNIHQKILQMELPENKLFNLAEGKLPIERSKSGNDKILDVLSRNDKDPILDYHAEAKEICSKLIHYLEKNYIKSENLG